MYHCQNKTLKKRVNFLIIKIKRTLPPDMLHTKVTVSFNSMAHNNTQHCILVGQVYNYLTFFVKHKRTTCERVFKHKCGKSLMCIKLNDK